MIISNALFMGNNVQFEGSQIKKKNKPFILLNHSVHGGTLVNCFGSEKSHKNLYGVLHWCIKN